MGVILESKAFQVCQPLKVSLQFGGAIGANDNEAVKLRTYRIGQ
jgi:hypothetical protein